MTRLPTPLFALLAVLLAVAIPFAAAAPGHADQPSAGQPLLQEAANESAGNGTAPGATLNGALGSEAAELDGEVERRSLDHAVGSATSTEGRAAVVSARLEAIEERLVALEAREERLAAARDNGTITDAEYRAQMTVVAAQARSLDRLSDRTAIYADGLPPEALVERGVTPDRVADLRATAGNLSAYDRDLFEGTYGDRPLPKGGLDVPFQNGTLDDSWWNGTAMNETTGNVTDGIDWNTTIENGTDGFELNVTDS